MNRRRLIWTLVVALCLVAAGLALWLPRHAAAQRVSDLYRHYEHNPHLDVAFIKDFPLNDTLSVDVTTISATDDEGWDSLCVNLNVPVLPVSYLELFEDKDDLVISYKVASDFTEFLHDIGVGKMNTVSVSYFNHQVVIFDTETKEQQHAVLHYNLKKSTKQKKKNETESKNNCSMHSTWAFARRMPERRFSRKWFNSGFRRNYTLRRVYC